MGWASVEAIDAEWSTRAHPNYIDEIKGLTCGRNITRRNIAADFVVISIFEGREALESYIVHPNHQAGVEKWKATDWQQFFCRRRRAAASLTRC
jgi:hypothetical protein